MDVVLRTPTGEAELSVGPGHEDIPLAELIERVTGRAPSQVVFVDGRAVPSSVALGTSGVLTGSIIATVDVAAVPTPDSRIELVQVAGEGAGARVWLRPGHFRIGIGRRISAGELELAPVDRPMLDVEVDDGGSVTLRATSTPARLDGIALSADTPTAWTTGLVDVGGRVFELGRRDPREATQSGHRYAGVGIDGTAAFNRPPRLAPPPEPPPLDVPDDGAATGGAPRLSRRAIRRARGGRAADDPARRRTPAAQFRAAAAQRHRDDVERRRREHPDLAAAVALADAVSPALWQRRAGHADVFRIPIGLADLDWSPPLDRGPQALANAQTIVAELGRMPLVPVTVDLLAERGVGIVGGGHFTRSLARGLIVEAAITHGPADLDVVVLSSPARAHSWEWVKWLPHARAGGSTRIYSTHDQVAGWAAAVRRGWDRPTRPTAPSHMTLVVVDEPGWWRDRAAPLRPLFSDASMPLRFVALTTAAADVPAVCTTVVTARPDHGATVDYLMDRRRIDDLHPFLASEQLALAIARRLAPLDDPDVAIVAESSLPSRVPLLQMLGLEAPTARHVLDTWARRADGSADGSAAIPIGVSDRGPLVVDLVADGPHGLIAGTSGSGKSELLRTVVAGLAATIPPDEINFLLIDGHVGATFGACVELPHTAGLVTDLDDHAARRLMRCLNGELRYRADALRRAGVASFADQQRQKQQRLDGVGPVPRLVIVVDEFASVATRVPELVPALADIAERGRSLGVHLLIVTQRPAGVVDDRIRAETNVRIALRVQDDGDSLDVIGIRDAAHLARRQPGRGFLRVGTGAPTTFQVATSHGVADDLALQMSAAGSTIVEVTPWVIARELTPMEQRLVRVSAAEATHSAATPSDLERLVTVIGDAAAELDARPPRRPCPDPLPNGIELDEFFAGHPGDAIPYGLVDLPDEQRQDPAWWAPGPEGSLVAFGVAGSGTTSLLVTLALGIAERCGPDDVHVYCIDADGGTLAPLSALPHVGAVVTVDEPDRIARVTTALADLLDRRSQMADEGRGANAVAAAEPSVVVMIDDLGALRELLDARRDLGGVWEELERVIRDGGPLGICTVMTAKHDGVVPPAVVSQASTRLVMQAGEQSGEWPGEHIGGSTLGSAVPGSTPLGSAPPDLASSVPGRAYRLNGRAEVQLVAPPTALADAIARARPEPATERPVRRVDPLAASVAVDSVLDAARLGTQAIEVPVGLNMRTGAPAVCPVTFGESVFITGAPGTGRSSLLAAVARASATVAPDVAVFAVAPRGGPLTEIDGLDMPARSDDVADWVDRIEATAGRRVVLVDDADRVGGPSFERLAGLRDDDLVVVVAGRADELRAGGHWSKPLQRYRTGVLLRPDAADADILRVSLGPRVAMFAPHHGVLVVDGAQVLLLAAVIGAADESAESEPDVDAAPGGLG